MNAIESQIWVWEPVKQYLDYSCHRNCDLIGWIQMSKLLDTYSLLDTYNQVRYLHWLSYNLQ